MVDIKRIRENPKVLERAFLKTKEKENIKEILLLDAKRRKTIFEVEKLKSEQNLKSKLIPKYKKEGKDTDLLMKEMKELAKKGKELNTILKVQEEEIEKELLNIPNIPQDSVPIGRNAEDNIELRRKGIPRKFEFKPKPHWEIGESLDILDFAKAAKVTGSRFTIYKGLGARLERALINFMLDLHIEEHGYIEVFPPFMVHRKSMIGTGQLPKFEEDAFKVTGTDYFLIPTAEVPVTNMYRDQILKSEELPIKHVAYSACFRAEAGSAGKDTRGLIRQHQFNKVELVKFTLPEESNRELEELTQNAEKTLELLEIPYRTVKLCTGDLGFSSAITYDIEVWMPSYNRYVEISSCSNFEDFQARRAGIRFKREPKAKTEFVHTLNGSGVAVGRATACILENFQREDGTVEIPKVLRRYMNNRESIK